MQRRNLLKFAAAIAAAPAVPVVAKAEVERKLTEQEIDELILKEILDRNEIPFEALRRGWEAKTKKQQEEFQRALSHPKEWKRWIDSTRRRKS